MVHESSAFVTLTYSDEFLPKDLSLKPKHLQDWLKRLRFELSLQGRKIRFYGVGEYGTKTQRPHYHILVFGLKPCLTGVSRCTLCPDCNLVHRTWNNEGTRTNPQVTGGFTDIGHDLVNNDIASYVGGYITKKWTNRHDERTKTILAGRHPEFARMSLQPGIGAIAVDQLAEYFKTDLGKTALEINKGDVPTFVRLVGKSFPIGRYLRSMIRKALGFEEIGAQPGWEEDAKINAQARVLEMLIKEGSIQSIEKAKEIYEWRKKNYSSSFKKDVQRMYIDENKEFNKHIESKEAFDKIKGRKL